MKNDAHESLEQYSQRTGRRNRRQKEAKVCSKLKVTDDVCLKEQRRKIQSPELQV